jgi:hypothetical protein
MLKRTHESYKLLILLIGLFILLIDPSFAGEKLNEIGKIVYSPETSSFYFLF